MYDSVSTLLHVPGTIQHERNSWLNDMFSLEQREWFFFAVESAPPIHEASGLAMKHNYHYRQSEIAPIPPFLFPFPSSIPPQLLRINVKLPLPDRSIQTENTSRIIKIISSILIRIIVFVAIMAIIATVLGANPYNNDNNNPACHNLYSLNHYPKKAQPHQISQSTYFIITPKSFYYTPLNTNTTLPFHTPQNCRSPQLASVSTPRPALSDTFL